MLNRASMRISFDPDERHRQWESQDHAPSDAEKKTNAECTKLMHRRLECAGGPTRCTIRSAIAPGASRLRIVIAQASRKHLVGRRICTGAAVLDSHRVDLVADLRFPPRCCEGQR